MTGFLGRLWVGAAELRVDADLEDGDGGSGGFFEGFSGEGDEGAEEGLEALEGFGNAVVVGGGAGGIPPFAFGGEGHEDAERVFRAELVAPREGVAAVLGGSAG